MMTLDYAQRRQSEGLRRLREHRGGRVFLWCGEHLFLGLSLFVCIPPVPSEPGQHYHPSYGLVVSFMLLSRLMAMGLRQESWAGLLAKVLIILPFAWVLNMRVLM